MSDSVRKSAAVIAALLAICATVVVIAMPASRPATEKPSTTYSVTILPNGEIATDTTGWQPTTVPLVPYTEAMTEGEKPAWNSDE